MVDSLRAKGVVPTATSCLDWGVRFLGGPRLARRTRGATFRFADAEYRYCEARYRWTWLGERSVEVPIAARLVDATVGRVLEVGNVLSHYRPVTHEVVDKYERSPGVRNADVLELNEMGAYDLVLSLSTIEHVGWDEYPRDPELAIEAMRRLQRLVAPGGRLLVTVPVGYHPRLDRCILDGDLSFGEVRALACAYPSGGWREIPTELVAQYPYDKLLYRAGAILVGLT
jgi:SAM-dependent methyltransferase